jgi:hypothetical protein
VAAGAGPLREMLCVQEERVLARDNTVTLDQLAAAAGKPVAATLRERQGAGASVPRRHPRGVPRPAMDRVLRRARSTDQRGPAPQKRDTVFAAVKDATRRLRRWPLRKKCVRSPAQCDVR